jgi:hypothetical protein
MCAVGRKALVAGANYSLETERMVPLDGAPIRSERSLDKAFNSQLYEAFEKQD